MSDYEKVASAISYIRENVGKQPTLDEIAAQVHLSPYHFQRLFSRWAGVTPKRFLQVLTLRHAKTLLKESDLSVLDVSDAVGLSSGSRLYDHFVHLEAVTPSEYKLAGRGLAISYGCHSTPFGDAFIGLTQRGICKFVFVGEETEIELLDSLQQEWPMAGLVEDVGKTAAKVEAMFYGDSAKATPLSLLVRGTNFQIKVWQALLNIKAGEIVSYGDIARLIGKPKASRAVGTAIAANPIAYIIPCHRVIQQSGGLGGYRWGETRKHAILAREAAIKS